MPSQNKPTVVVAEVLQQPALEYLENHANIVHATPETVGDFIADADGLVVRTYTQVNRDLLDRAPKLKVVARAGVALENVDVRECWARDIAVVHTPAANTLAVVDYTIRMMIEMNRKFWPMPSYTTPEDFHKLRKQTFGRFLADCTLGIIGAGRIGSRVARAASALGMTVLYNDILDIKFDFPAKAVSKDELYARADIITIHTPVTDLTRKFINAESLGKTKPGVQFINAARGHCVDYDALGEFVRTGHVSAAVIDCHDPEPMPEDYPLWGLENVILTPHVAACVPKAKLNMSMVVKDVVAVLQNRSPEYPAVEGAF